MFDIRARNPHAFPLRIAHAQKPLLAMRKRNRLFGIVYESGAAQVEAGSPADDVPAVVRVRVRGDEARTDGHIAVEHYENFAGRSARAGIGRGRPPSGLRVTQPSDRKKRLRLRNHIRSRVPGTVVDDDNFRQALLPFEGCKRQAQTRRLVMSSNDNANTHAP